ncbi:IS1595 family transposase [Lichenifustis flavocetrariae]|uniref:IS1595 family transposase n=1 Tax=Lichenifustis flavocetrariae TaxID=2949735 RepID=A0AA42CLA3_9HYPH|nr:IS1595 family transposase [Lichenifustis flavocetrariae]MCW6511404.1 IS1595 family transposase [Lichenifustis flavocetrariae]
MSVLSARYLHDEAAAFQHLENVLWPAGPVCPHCGSISGKHYDLRKSRVGLRKCSDCRKQFTVKIGTVFESAHIPLNKMLQAVYLMVSSKKGISAHQLHRTIGVTYKSAWFLAHRIHLAMDTSASFFDQLGGLGAIVEADETYVGKYDDVPHRTKGYATKLTVLTLVERGGTSRSFHVSGHSAAALAPYLKANINKHSVLMTDEGKWYTETGKGFLDHQTVNHSEKEWKRGYAHTQTVEGFFSVFKRGMKGVYQHCSEKHLHRYLAEFDFRYSNRVKLGVDDAQRNERALEGIKGKRLKYRPADEARASTV